jgi:hypothetical protein
MYSKRTGLVIGFHGCDKEIRDRVVSEKGFVLLKSKNNYDWLGNGIYFWENNYKRAFQYAKEMSKSPVKGKYPIHKPAVVGAIIDLGYCLDLLDSEYLETLKTGYNLLVNIHKNYNKPIPENKPFGKEKDLIIRHLDCAVIETIHKFNYDKKLTAYDSVRGVFFEGKELYPNAGFQEKNHIQIAIRNPNCIKGYFIPREKDTEYPLP